MMKRIVACFLVVALILTGMSFPQRKAYGEVLPRIEGTTKVSETGGEVQTFGEWRYYVDHGEAVITGYGNTGEHNLRIPNELGGYLVRGIAQRAFVEFSSLNIQIPSMITWIAPDAFPAQTTIQAYSGAYAHSYAEARGYRKVNLTDGMGMFTFRDGIVDFAGFPDNLYKAKANNDIELSISLSGIFREGQYVYVPSQSKVLNVYAGKIGSIEKGAAGEILHIVSVSDIEELFTRISFEDELVADMDHAVAYGEGVSLEDARGSVSGSPSKSAGKTFKLTDKTFESLNKVLKVTVNGSYTINVTGTVVYDIGAHFIGIDVDDAKLVLTKTESFDFTVKATLKAGKHIKKNPTFAITKIGTIPIASLAGVVSIDLDVYLTASMEGEISVFTSKTTTMTVGIENGKKVSRTEETKAPPTIEGSIEGYIEFNLSVVGSIGFKILGHGFSADLASITFGLRFDFSLKMTYTAGDIASCGDLKLSLKLVLTGKVGLIKIHFIKDWGGPYASASIDKELVSFHKHIEIREGEIFLLDNCWVKNRTAVYYLDGKQLTTQRVNAGSVISAPGDQQKAGYKFDGWWFYPAESGLTGEAYKWDFVSYKLPVIPYGSNYVFKASFIKADQPVTTSGNQPKSGGAGKGRYGSRTPTPVPTPEITPTPTSTPTPTPTPVPVSRVELNIHQAELYAGDANRDSVQLSAALEPPDAANKDIQWLSSDEAVAYVNADGKVIGLSAGKAVISCVSLSNPDKKDTCEVTVHQTITGIYIQGDAEGLLIGETVQLTASLFPLNADNKSISWSSSDEKIATVDQHGKVTAAGIGTAVITVRTQDGTDLTAQTPVSVGKPLVIRLNIYNAEVYPGGDERVDLGGVYLLPASVRRIADDLDSVTWSIENAETSIADISGAEQMMIYTVNGKDVEIPALQLYTTAIREAGEAVYIIKCQAGGEEATCEVRLRVCDETVSQNVSLEKTTYDIAIGESIRIPELPLAKDQGHIPKDMNLELQGDAFFDRNAEIYLDEDNELWVEFKASGQYSAMAVYSISNVKYKVPLTFMVRDENGIVHLPVEMVSIEESTVELVEGESRKLALSIFPTDAYDTDIEWISENPEIATISGDGVVSAVQGGSTIVIARAKDGSGREDSCFIKVEKFIELIEHEAEYTVYEGKQTRAELDICSLSYASSKRLAEQDMDVTWTLERMSGNSTEVALEQYEAITGTGVRIIGNRLQLLRIYSTGTDVYKLSVQSGSYSDTCMITLRTTGSSVLPEEISLKTTEYTTTVGESLEIDPTISCFPTDRKLPDDAALSMEQTNAYWRAIDDSTRGNDFEPTFVIPGVFTAYIVYSGSNYSYRLPIKVTVKAEDGTVPVIPEEIELSSEKAELLVGDSVTLTATVRPTDADFGSLTWSSADTGIASVSADGKVTAVGAGTTAITVSSTLGECTNAVVIRVEDGLTLSDDVYEKTIFVDGTTRKTLNTVYLTEASSRRINDSPEWHLERVSGTNLTLRINPTDIVNESGETIYGCDINLYSVSATGTTEYALTAKYGDQQDTLRILITAVERDNYLPASISLGISRFEAGIGELIKVVPEITCWPDGTSLPDGTILSVEGDKLFHKAIEPADWYVGQKLSTFSFNQAGRYEANFIYSYSNISYTIPVEFYIHDSDGTVPVPAMKMTLNSSSLFMTVGDSEQLTPVFTPGDVTNADVSWKSSDPSVAKVDQSGKVTANAYGSADITCTPMDTSLPEVVCHVEVEPFLAVETGATEMSVYLEGAPDYSLSSAILSAGTVQRLADAGLSPAWSFKLKNGNSAEMMAEQKDDRMLVQTTSLNKVGKTVYTITCIAGQYSWTEDYTVNVISLGKEAPESITLAMPEVDLAVGETKTVSFAPVCVPSSAQVPEDVVMTYMGLGDFYDALDREAYVRDGDNVTVAFKRAGKYMLARTYTRRNLNYTSLCVFNVASDLDRVSFLNASETSSIVYQNGTQGIVSRIQIPDAGILERYGDKLDWKLEILAGTTARAALSRTKDGVDLHVTETKGTGMTVLRVSCGFENVSDYVDIAIDVREARTLLPDAIELSSNRIKGSIGTWLSLPLGVKCAPAGSALPVLGDSCWAFAMRGEYGNQAFESLIEHGMLKINFAEPGYYTGDLQYAEGNVSYQLPVYFTVADEEGVVPEPDSLAIWVDSGANTIFADGEKNIVVASARLAKNANTYYEGLTPAYLAGSNIEWSIKVTSGSASLSMIPTEKGSADILLKGVSGTGKIGYEITCKVDGKKYTAKDEFIIGNSANLHYSLSKNKYNTTVGELLTVDYLLHQGDSSVLQGSREWNVGDAAVSYYDQTADHMYMAAFMETGTYVTYIEGYIGNLAMKFPVTVIVEEDAGRPSIVRLTLPAALVEIEEYAFEGTRINQVDLSGTGIKTIGAYAFANCTDLTDLYLPETLSDIAPTAFYHSENVTFHCSSGSEAARYARENNIPVVYTSN